MTKANFNAQETDSSKYGQNAYLRPAKERFKPIDAANDGSESVVVVLEKVFGNPEDLKRQFTRWGNHDNARA